MSYHLLLIPFHFPPIQGSTGAFRSLSFCKWLPESDWRVSVLTVCERAYPESSSANYELIDSDSAVYRAFGLDAKRHLSIAGRYLRITALPDRWSSWIIGGVISGLKIIKRDAPNVIYTTYPVPSSHVIGLILHKITGIAWIAEFRDPMVEEGFPANRIERFIRTRIEGAIFDSASRIVTVTPSAKKLYEARTRGKRASVVQIANGFDDSILGSNFGGPAISQEQQRHSLEILHSGILYDDVRNPTKLFEALRELDLEGFFTNNDVKFIFRGSGCETNYREIAQQMGIDALVEFRESVSYAEAHDEMQRADALLLMQGHQCNRQIPAKFYEYCALQKPILCLADPAGDTGDLFMRCGLGESVALEDSKSINIQIKSFVHNWHNNSEKIATSQLLESMSRRARARELASVLLDVVGKDAI